MKVAIYARVSSEEQQERGTIENQLEFARKYIDLHQLEVVEWYKDDGISGTIPLEERNAGKIVVENARAGKFKQLLVYKLDRLGRSARIILNAVYDLEQAGISVKSMTEPFDTGDPSGRFLLTILAGVADLERETILERMWLGANRAARAGKWLGGIVPYGYYVNEESLLVVSDTPLPGQAMSESDVVRLIYHLVADQGWSTIKVADYLNALNIPPAYTKSGRKIKRGKRKESTAGIWRPARVRNMIINETYKGIHYYGKRATKERELIKREVPAIVSEEMWNKAQAALKNNQLESLKNSKRRQYLLRGLVKCGTCGLSYSGIHYNGPGGKPKAYYVCNGKTAYKGPKQGKCTSKNVPAAWIENIVWVEILNFVENPGLAIKEMAATLEEKKPNIDNLAEDKTAILKAIDDKDTEKQSILDLFRKKIITQSDVEIQVNKINREKSVLEERLINYENLVKENLNIEKQFDTIKKMLTKIRERIYTELSFEEKREIIKSLVNEVRVYTKDGENNTSRKKAQVSIVYNFSQDVVHTDAPADITEIR